MQKLSNEVENFQGKFKEAGIPRYFINSFISLKSMDLKTIGLAVAADAAINLSVESARQVASTLLTDPKFQNIYVNIMKSVKNNKMNSVVPQLKAMEKYVLKTIESNSQSKSQNKAK